MNVLFHCRQRIHHRLYDDNNKHHHHHYHYHRHRSCPRSVNGRYIDILWHCQCGSELTELVIIPFPLLYSYSVYTPNDLLIFLGCFSPTPPSFLLLFSFCCCCWLLVNEQSVYKMRFTICQPDSSPPKPISAQPSPVLSEF